MVKSRYIGDGHPTFNRNPYNGYINPYYWVDDHPLLYGNNGSLDPPRSVVERADPRLLMIHEAELNAFYTNHAVMQHMHHLDKSIRKSVPRVFRKLIFSTILTRYSLAYVIT